MGVDTVNDSCQLLGLIVVSDVFIIRVGVIVVTRVDLMLKVTDEVDEGLLAFDYFSVLMGCLVDLSIRELSEHSSLLLGELDLEASDVGLDHAIEHVGHVLNDVSGLESDIVVLVLLEVSVELHSVTDCLDGVPDGCNFFFVTVYKEVLDSLLHERHDGSNGLGLGLVDELVLEILLIGLFFII
jgi:hypothetical protein